MSKERVAAGAAVVSGVVAAAGPVLESLGIASVAHSSGAAILTGGGGYISGTIGVIGSAAGLISAPLVTAGAGIIAAGLAGYAAYAKLRH